MKNKYQNILLDAASMVGKIPGVSISGSTATASAYISAYRDYYEACNMLGVIANDIRLIDDLENTINKNKNKDECDIEELKGQLSWYIERVEKTFAELKNYINDRERQRWS